MLAKCVCYERNLFNDSDALNTSDTLTVFVHIVRPEQSPGFPRYHDTSIGTEHRDGAVNEIHDGVVVSVVVRSAFRTRPCADGKVFDLRVLLTADRANLTGREPPVDLDEASAHSLNLVLDESEKLSPPDGSDGLGQMAVLHHAPDIEVLTDEDFTRVSYDAR